MRHSKQLKQYKASLIYALEHNEKEKGTLYGANVIELIEMIKKSKNETDDSIRKYMDNYRWRFESLELNEFMPNTTVEGAEAAKLTEIVPGTAAVEHDRQIGINK